MNKTIAPCATSADFSEITDAISARVGENGFLKIACVVQQIAQNNRSVFIRLMEQIPALIDNVLRFGNSSSVLNLFEMAEQTARRHPSPAVFLLGKGPELLEKLGDTGLNAVAELVSNIAGFSWETASKIADSSPVFFDILLKQVNGSVVLSVYRLANRIASKNWGAACRLLDESPDIIKNLPLAQTKSVFELAEKAGHQDPMLAFHLLKKSPELLERIGYEGLKKIADACLKIAHFSSDCAIRLIETCPKLIDELLPYGDPFLILRIYELAVDLAETNEKAAVNVCEISPRLIQEAGLKGLITLIQLCRQFDQENRQAVIGLIEASPCLIQRIGFKGVQRVISLGIQLSQVCCRTAVRFCSKSPDIIDTISYEELDNFVGFCMNLAKDGSSVSIRFLEQGLGISARLLTKGGRPLLNAVYSLMCRAAADNPILSFKIFEKSPELIDRIGYDGLKAFAALAGRIAKESWTVADCLVKTSTDLIDRVGFAGLKKVSDISLNIARENVFGAVSLIEMSPNLMDRLRIYDSALRVMDVYEIGAEAAGSHWTVMIKFLEKSPELLNAFGWKGLKRIARIGFDAAKIEPRMATGMLDVCIDLLRRIDDDCFSAIVDYCVRLSVHDPEKAVQAIVKSPDLMDRILRLEDNSVVKDVYDTAGRVAESSWRASLRLLEKSPDYIDIAGYIGFALIGHRVWELSKIDEETAIRFVNGKSLDFTEFMEEIPKGLELDRVKPILSRYLAALLGDRVIIEAGDEASTDGRKIYLPKRVREFDSDDENFIYYKVLSTHLEAHLEYGSFEFDLTEIRDIVKTAELKYGGKVGSADSDIEKFYRLFPEPEMIRDLITLFEDYRIEFRLKKEYPVLGLQIEKVNAHNLKKRSRYQKIENDKQKTVEMIGDMLFVDGAYKDLEAPVDRIIRRAKIQKTRLQSFDSTICDAVRAAVDLYTVIDSTFTVPYPAVKPISRPIDQKRVEKNIGNFKKLAKTIGEKLQGETTRQQVESIFGSEGNRSDSGETDPSKQKPAQHDHALSTQHVSEKSAAFEEQDPRGKFGHNTTSSTEKDSDEANNIMKFSSMSRVEKLLRTLFKEKGITPKEIESKTRYLKPDQIELFLQNLESTITLTAELEKEKGTYLYPEWDENLGGYRNNWTRIREQNIKQNNQRFYHETLFKYQGLLKKIKREFQMMKPEELMQITRQLDGHEIDLDATVEYLTDIKLSLSPSEKNYVRTEKNRRDIAVAFLIDMSKSTKGIPIRCEKEALIIMSEALQQVGDAFGIYGFSGDNRDNIDFFKVKDFEEGYTQTVKARISSIDYRFENRDGTAIRHTSSLLKKREEKTKLMVLLSDGKPLDKEYSGGYAIEDTRMALLEAQKAGIHTFCITIDKSAPDYLSKMHRHSSWIVIDDVNKLPEKLSRIYGRLTR